APRIRHHVLHLPKPLSDLGRGLGRPASGEGASCQARKGFRSGLSLTKLPAPTPQLPPARWLAGDGEAVFQPGHFARTPRGSESSAWLAGAAIRSAIAPLSPASVPDSLLPGSWIRHSSSLADRLR